MVGRSFPKGSTHPSFGVGRQVAGLSGSTPGRRYPAQHKGVTFAGDRNRVTNLQKGGGSHDRGPYPASHHRPFESEQKG